MQIQLGQDSPAQSDSTEKQGAASSSTQIQPIEKQLKELEAVQRHPKGSRARVLLASVFGPYAQDDEFGGRAMNPMELYHNQVTRAQGAFSLRMFHRSWGIKMIQANITAPCTLLDFPTRESFTQELCSENYDVVGISSIITNVGKMREMFRIIRERSPHSVIV